MEFVVTGQDLSLVITASTTGLGVLIASVVSAYNSIRANKQSAATHELISGDQTNANQEG